MQNSDKGISDFQIFGQSLINDNCHNSIPSADIAMKLGPETKTDKRNTATSKKLDNGVMSTNCNVTVILPTYNQFGAIFKEDSGRMVCNTYIFTNSIILSYEN